MKPSPRHKEVLVSWALPGSLAGGSYSSPTTRRISRLTSTHESSVGAVTKTVSRRPFFCIKIHLNSRSFKNSRSIVFTKVCGVFYAQSSTKNSGRFGRASRSLSLAQYQSSSVKLSNFFCNLSWPIKSTHSPYSRGEAKYDKIKSFSGSFPFLKPT